MVSILVATDLSERSAPAIQRAARLIRQFGGDLTLLHVVDNEAPRDLVGRYVDHTIPLLRAQAERLAEQAGTEPKIIVTSGEVEPTIVSTAQDLGSDLLVVGAHRKSAIRDFFLGTTVERVIRTSRIPVLRVATPALRDYTRSLVAMDLSPVSVDAFTAARRLGLLTEGDFEAVYAVELIPVGTMAEVMPDPRFADDMLRDAREKSIEYLRQADIEIADSRLQVREGEPRQVLAHAMEKSNADLLVVGTHARRGVQRVMIGSVACSLLASLDVDILTVPPAV